MLGATSHNTRRIFRLTCTPNLGSLTGAIGWWLSSGQKRLNIIFPPILPDNLNVFLLLLLLPCDAILADVFGQIWMGVCGCVFVCDIHHLFGG